MIIKDSEIPCGPEFDENNNSSIGIMISAEEKASVIEVTNTIDLFMSSARVDYNRPFLAYDDLPGVFWNIIYFITRIIADDEDVTFRGHYKDGRFFYSFFDDMEDESTQDTNSEEEEDEDRDEK